jgi:hypothetical protein
MGEFILLEGEKLGEIGRRGRENMMIAHFLL